MSTHAGEATVSHTARLEHHRRQRLAVLVLLALVAGLLVPMTANANHLPADFAHLRQVGPVSGSHGFPVWYEDAGIPDLGEPALQEAVGPAREPLRLELCQDTNGMCFLEDDVDQTQPISFPDNFGFEQFWFLAEAEITSANGMDALVVMGLEATFDPEVITWGNQISFGRIRVRAWDFVPGGTYTFTHPYGVDVYQAEANDGRNINVTEDIGGGDFAEAFESRIGPFLTWPDYTTNPDTNVDGHTYVGNPSIESPVVGSPNGTNFFRIEGPDIVPAAGQECPGIPTNCMQTEMFSVFGKVAETSGVEGIEAFYSRDDDPATPHSLDVFGYAAAGRAITVSGDGFPTTTLAGDGERYFGRVEFSGDVPDKVTLTNLSDDPPTFSEIAVTDRVEVSLAAYGGSDGTPGDPGSPGTMTRFEETDPALGLQTTGTWLPLSHVERSGGAMIYADSAGATATLEVTGPEFRWIGSRGPQRGTAQVLIDGDLAATIDLYQPAWAYQQVLFATDQLGTGATVTIVNTGTSSGPGAARTEIDAVEMLVGWQAPTPGSGGSGTPGMLEIQATSSDQMGSPTLTAEGLGTLSSGTLLVETEAPPPYVTVRSSAGGQETRSVRIASDAMEPLPLAAIAGPDRTVLTDTTVVLDGRSSTGDIASYSWTQLAGSVVTLSGADTSVASFVAPVVDEEEVFIFQLEVTGTFGGVEAAEVTITVVSPSEEEQQPIANAGSDILDAALGATVSLDGAGSQNAVSFSWTQTSGPDVTLAGAATATPSFTFPGEAASLEFELTVTASGGATDTDTVTVSSALDGVGATDAQYRTNSQRWEIRGTTVLPGGLPYLNSVELSVVRSGGGEVFLGTLTVDDLGEFRFRQKGANVTAAAGDQLLVRTRYGATASFPIQVRN